MKVANAWKLVGLALVVMVVALALVVPVVGGAVARVDSGSPVAAECQSGHSCGGSMIAGITPTPAPPGRTPSVRVGPLVEAE